MSRKCPYSFPLRSRAAMTDYICEDWRAYYTRGERFPLGWNVRADRINLDTPAIRADLNLESRFDDQWDSYAESVPDLFWQACEDASRYYVEEGLYCSYPGTDQGDYKFTTRGRCGGNMVLTHWRGYQLEGMYPDNLREFCEELDFSELRALYRAIVCMDSDLTPQKASEEVSYQLAFYRQAWEDERREEEKEESAALEESRPDLYDSAICG